MIFIGFIMGDVFCVFYSIIDLVLVLMVNKCVWWFGILLEVCLEVGVLGGLVSCELECRGFLKGVMIVKVDRFMEFVVILVLVLFLKVNLVSFYFLEFGFVVFFLV